MDLKECAKSLHTHEDTVLMLAKKGLIPCQQEQGNLEFDEEAVGFWWKGLIQESYKKYYWSESHEIFSALTWAKYLVKKGILKEHTVTVKDEHGKEHQMALADEGQYDDYLTFLLEEFIPHQLMKYKAKDNYNYENRFINYFVKKYSLKQFFKKKYVTNPKSGESGDIIGGEFFSLEGMSKVSIWNNYENFQSDNFNKDTDIIKTKDNAKESEKEKGVKIKHNPLLQDDLLGKPATIINDLETNELREKVIKTLLEDLRKECNNPNISKRKRTQLKKEITICLSILHHEFLDEYPKRVDKSLAERFKVDPSRIRQIITINLRNRVDEIFKKLNIEIGDLYD